MAHYITEAEIKQLKEQGDLTISQMVFGSFGKGHAKRLVAVWSILTDERYFVIENRKEIYHTTTEFDEAVRAYNEV